MKMSKKAFQILCLGLTLFMANALQAQTEGKPMQRTPMTAEERAQKQTDRQKEELGLNDEQYEKALNINKGHAKKLETLREAGKEDREKMKADAKAIEDSREAELKAVFTDEQYKKYQQNKQEKVDKLRERKGKGKLEKKGKFPRKQD